MANTITKTPAKNTGFNGSLEDSKISCVIAQGTKIEGKFHSTEHARVDGTIIGEFLCDKKLVLGKMGRVEGNIKANEAVILGKVQGDLAIKERLHLQATAAIQGNITAGRIIVDEGARYEGQCRIS